MRRISLVLAVGALLALFAVAAPPPAHAITLCLNSFCDTMECGVDNGNNVSCLWDYRCAGATDGEMLGTSEAGGRVIVAGGINFNSIPLTESWEINGPARSVDVWLWRGIGSTQLLASDTFTINCTVGAQKPKPSMHEALGR